MDQVLKVAAGNSFFRITENKYHGLGVRKYGVRLLSYKVEAIKFIDYPTNVCDVHKF